MKKNGIILLVALFLACAQPALSQNKKYDKSLAKIDASYAGGSFEKAESSLAKLKKTITAKMGPQNTYMPGLYLREARIGLALGMLGGFDKALENAQASSLAVFGENSASYATTQIDVAEIYNAYGNYRISREYSTKAKEQLIRTGQMTDLLKGRIALVESEALIGQGFCNDALGIMREQESFFASRAVEKETKVESGVIKTQRVPETELIQRYGDYARLLTQIAVAYSKKGSLISADSAFTAARTWLKSNRRFLGETDLSAERNNYQWAISLIENGNLILPKELELNRTLDDLKKKANPTNTLAQDIYIAHLHKLLVDEEKNRYVNTKAEFEKVLSKYFSKGSVVRINLQAVEFDTKLGRDKTKNVEGEALGVLNTKTLPRNHPTALKILNFLYNAAIAEKRYANAESYLNQRLEIEKELYGEISPAYHLSRIFAANFYLDYTNKFEEAGKIYEESYNKIVAPQIGDRHKDLLDILNHLATYYEAVDSYARASKTLKAALEAARLKYDYKDILYAAELNKIAYLQLKLGEYEEAEKGLTKSLEVIDMKDNRDYKEWRPTYINALETQAKLYGIKGMFDEAESSLERSHKLITRSKTDINSELSAEEELTALFIQLGRFSEADRLVADQIPESEKLYGNTSRRLIDPLVNKGRLLLAKGDYTEAERTATRANQIAVKTYGMTSTKTAPTQKLLSDIYYTLGDYDKAEENITKALSSQEKQFGRNHIEVARSLAQLALIKFYKGDNSKEVEKLMLEARTVIETRLGKDNPQYAEIMKNMAVLYISEKKFDIAFNALTVAENIWRTKTGTKNNINAAAIYTLTGDVYYQQKNYKKSEEFYNQAKDLYEKFFSRTHPEYVKVLSKLSKVYYMQHDYKRSKNMIEESLNNYEKFIKEFFPALSEREKAKYWNTIKGDFEFYNTLAFSNLDDFKDLAGKIYNYQLLTKALLLSSSIKVRERILNSTDEELKTQYTTWVQKKEMLTLALSMSPAQLTENQIDPMGLQQEVERLEKDLSQSSELFGQSFDDKRISFEDVKKILKPNDVAIEMVRYRHFNHSFTDSIIYAALYIKKDMVKPRVVMLKDGKKMETRFFKFYRNAIVGKVPDTYSYGVFWEPIAKEIGQAATVYLSADGVYNQINLEAIPTPDGKYVIDNSNIVLVSNTKDLYLRSIKTRPSATENTATMFGNPSFYVTASADQRISALPGTEKEVTQVQFMLKQKGWLTAEYMEKLASEEKIKELKNPKIFHIATHGFYRPSMQVSLEQEIEGNEAMLAQNPLMRTGLLLRGAGDLMDKTQYNFNMENGILTAYEAMSLNLDKTDLVVLSACETGLGDMEAGEGVYGLQRAFLVAGAKVLIMSMFKVDDEATQKLMLKFYQKWLNTGNLRESFIGAKKELRTEYPEPIYWGAFIMIGLE
ncbi:CHAT domain-containing protein [Fulvivirgaceae bacterium PWU5]|uniref:CHAT domain-containing protein n=1 Tax=Dawidia cretensis TaxID=2782350 RepID=A0AAP2GU34_9BACT|nr:CHAT domain-containing protein [Dawidia cretensis]MBT1708300.1 CHAT domain-containing protein [Dawidia cretensis]